MSSMDTSKMSDFSSLPQWVLGLYKPEEITPHVLVSAADEPDTYHIQEIDFNAINLYEKRLDFTREYPTKGEVEVFVGSPTDLYKRFLGAKVVLTGEASKRMSEAREVPMVFGHSTELSAYGLTNSGYEEFKFCEQAYDEDPENSVLAYGFINTHPMFWSVKKESRRGWTEVETSEGWKRVDVEISMERRGQKKDAARKTTVMLEAGPGNYHDYNLDVYAPSFDAAIVELAKLIKTHYDSHGGFTDKTKKEPNDNFNEDGETDSE